MSKAEKADPSQVIVFMEDQAFNGNILICYAILSV